MHFWVQFYAFFILATDGVGVQSQGSRLVTTHVTHGLVAVPNVVMQTCCERRLDSHKADKSLARPTDPVPVTSHVKSESIVVELT